MDAHCKRRLFIMLNIIDEDISDEITKENLSNIKLLYNVCTKRFGDAYFDYIGKIEYYDGNDGEILYYRDRTHGETLTIFAMDKLGNICGKGESIFKFIADNFNNDANPDHNLIFSLNHNSSLIKLDKCLAIYPSINCRYITIWDEVHKKAEILNNLLDSRISINLGGNPKDIYIMTAIIILAMDAIYRDKKNKKADEPYITNNEIVDIVKSECKKRFHGFMGIGMGIGDGIRRVVSKITSDVVEKILYSPSDYQNMEVIDFR